jgi:hypothetical protein
VTGTSSDIDDKAISGIMSVNLIMSATTTANRSATFKPQHTATFVSARFMTELPFFCDPPNSIGMKVAFAVLLLGSSYPLFQMDNMMLMSLPNDDSWSLLTSSSWLVNSLDFSVVQNILVAKYYANVI